MLTPGQTLWQLILITVATSAAISAFGWHHGLGLASAMWLLMPYSNR